MSAGQPIHHLTTQNSKPITRNKTNPLISKKGKEERKEKETAKIKIKNPAT
jgi:hypothetical protein